MTPAPLHSEARGTVGAHLAAGLGWLVVIGLVVHRCGEPAWSGPGDVVRLTGAHQ